MQQSSTRDAIIKERKDAERKVQQLEKQQLSELLTQKTKHLEEKATAQSMMRKARAIMRRAEMMLQESENQLDSNVIAQQEVEEEICRQQRTIALNSEIEEKGFFRFEDLPIEVQTMILRQALPCSLTLRHNERWGIPPSPLLLSRKINFIATPLFYEANTIVETRDYLPSYLQKHVVRLYIREDISHRLVKDLQECSNLKYLTLSPSHAPHNGWARPFQKLGKLSEIIVEDREGFRYANEWRKILNSTASQRRSRRQ